MRPIERLLVIGLAVSAILVAAGCGAKGDKLPEAAAASISGSNGEDASGNDIASPPSPQQPAAGKKNVPLYRPLVEVETTMGTFTVVLYGDKAPVTVKNFLAYVKEGFYDGTLIHYVDKASVMIAGGYSHDRREKKTSVPIDNEARVAGLSNTPYTIAMVRRPDAKHSATSQFFVNLADNSEGFDFKELSDEKYGYCVFGKIQSGQEVIQSIAKVDVIAKKENDIVFDQLPAEDIVIKSIKLIK